MSDSQISETSLASGAPTDASDRSPSKRKRWRVGRRGLLAAAGVTLSCGGLYFSRRERINLALIGSGMRGQQHAAALNQLSFVDSPYGNVVAICDCDLPKAESLRKSYWPRASVIQRYQDVLDDRAVDAVIISTPDHTHAQIAIDAMRRGKSVYIEKPIALTIEEGFALRRAAEETGAVVQVGTQQRSHATFHLAWQLVNNGRLGEIKKVRVQLSEWPLPEAVVDESAAPAGLDWDAWLGPTPLVPYSDYRHKLWHFLADYSNGMINGWGSHHFDIALWVMQKQFEMPRRVDGHGEVERPAVGTGCPRSYAIDFDYGDGVSYELVSAPKDHGIFFEGDKGRIFVNRGKVTGGPVEALSSSPLPRDALRVKSSRLPGSRGVIAQRQHYTNFFDSILSRDTPVSDLPSAVCVNTALCLANNSIQLGRPIDFDARTLSSPGDDEANRLIQRSRRPGFGL